MAKVFPFSKLPARFETHKNFGLMQASRRRLIGAGSVAPFGAALGLFVGLLVGGTHGGWRVGQAACQFCNSAPYFDNCFAIWPFDTCDRCLFVLGHADPFK